MSKQADKNSASVRKQLEGHRFIGEDGEEYGASKFGEFGDYFRRKKVKLQNEDIIMRHTMQGIPQIFKGVVAHVASYTQPPPEELHRQLVMHGANFIKYLDYKTMCTHIIASTLPPKKADEWRRLRVVKPAWVVDSVAAGRQLPWTDYSIFTEGAGQKRIQFNGGKMGVQEAKPNQMDGYKEQGKASYYTDQMEKFAARYDSIGSASKALQEMENKALALKSDMEYLNEVDAAAFDEPLSSLEQGDAPKTGQARRASGNGPGQLHPVQELDLEPDTLEKDEEDFGNVSFERIMDEAAQGEFTEDGHDQGREPEPESEPGRQRETGEGNGPGQNESPSKPTSISPSKKPQRPMTSEEHNAWLLSDPKIRKASTANPDFLKQFYSESRLHHLSTWKAELKSKMQRLTTEKSATAAAAARRSTTKRRPGQRRYIMHVDFDSFFCAVSLKSAPEYRDKPAAVAHSAGQASEIASCNYPARAFGVKNGMWMKRATELCPDLKVLPYDFPAYEEASRLFYEAILDVGGVVQSVSVDEALVDITRLVLDVAGSAGLGADEGSVWREQEQADRLAAQLRKQVLARTGCHVSVGIGGNILLAKVALRRAKPAGQFQIKPEDVLAILGELRVEQLPGVAYSIGGRLEENLGVKFVRDLRAVSRERLVGALGPKTGERLWEYARGIDGAEVGDQPVRKSVSAEVNWGIRFVSQEEAEVFVLNLCKELERRLLNEQVRGRNLTMKILRRSADAPLDPAKHLGHGRCDAFSKSVVFGVATHDAERIGREAVSILRSFHFSPGDLRGLGVQLQKLEPIRAAGAAADAEGSQKKLSFGNASSTYPNTAKTRSVAFASPDKNSGADSGSGSSHSPNSGSKSTVDAFLAPKRSLAPPSAPAPPPANFPSTQFFMPVDADPSVLAELPPDIRRRLVAREDAQSTDGASSRDASPHKPESRVQSPARPATASPARNPWRDPDELPPGIDVEVFAALPPEMRAEVLADYRQQQRPRASPSPRRLQNHSPSPSPRKGRKTTTATAPSARRTLWGGRGRGGGRGGAAAARERQNDAAANRVQMNFFVSAAAAQSDRLADAAAGDNGGGGASLEGLDSDVLAALPEDVRAEVIEDYRRRRLEAQPPPGLRLALPTTSRRPVLAAAAASGPDERRPARVPMLQFPAPPPKMSFRTAGDAGSSQDAPAVVLSLPETKNMVRTWHEATREEGPHEADVAVLERYLAGVVREERNMDKARQVVCWLEWLVEDVPDGERGYGKESWRLAVQRIKDAVQAAMETRGLPRMQFR